MKLEQLNFFWVGLIVIASLEASSRKGGLRYVRFLFEVGAVAYFMTAILLFNQQTTSADVRCGSKVGRKRSELKRATVGWVAVVDNEYLA